MTCSLRCTLCTLLIFLLTSSLLGAPAAKGQSSSASGRLEGYVVDSSGGSVSAATITVRSVSTGESVEQEADDRGHFVFLYLAPGAF
jgi:hypothetical protein